MYTKYTLHDGQKIEVFMWSDFFENETYRSFAEVWRYVNGKRTVKPVKRPVAVDDHGIYIVWNSEKIYLNDFDFMPYEQLMAKIKEGKEKNDRWLVSDDDILATFMKESEKVMVFASMPVYNIITPFGFALCGDKEMDIPCRLSTAQYPKERWGYKITLEPLEDLRKVCAKQNYYFSDFCSLLKADIFALADENLNIA